MSQKVVDKFYNIIRDIDNRQSGLSRIMDYIRREPEIPLGTKFNMYCDAKLGSDVHNAGTIQQLNCFRTGVYENRMGSQKNLIVDNLASILVQRGINIQLVPVRHIKETLDRMLGSRYTSRTRSDNTHAVDITQQIVDEFIEEVMNNDYRRLLIRR